MVKKTSVAKIFEYVPNAINLIGFTSRAEILDELRSFLGREALLSKFRRDGAYRRKIVDPSFPIEHIGKRQDFFQRIQSDHRIKKNFFVNGLPKVENPNDYASTGNFLELCEKIYQTLEKARKELKYFDNLPEAKRIILRTNQFDSRLESMIKKMQTIDKFYMFAIDSKKGLVANISEMPKNSMPFLSEEMITKGDWEWEKGIFDEIRLRMKKYTLAIAKEMGIEFKKEMMRYIKREFKFNLNEDNLRKDFEQLAMPTKLHSFYEQFLETCEEYNTELNSRFDDKEKIPEPVYPQFGNNYDFQQLFPPKLLTRWSFDEKFTPINFKTNPSERKFLIAGLHSGGKSFFLENIVLTSILGNAGFNLPADSITLPRYERIFYYRNVDNGNSGGKCETELQSINSIKSKAGENDLVIIDEFLDSANVEVATALSPAILEKLRKSPATVFVTSHRNTNYDWLEKNGWILMSPNYEIKNNLVVPTWALRRGPPDEEINKKYILQRYKDIFQE